MGYRSKLDRLAQRPQRAAERVMCTAAIQVPPRLLSAYNISDLPGVCKGENRIS